MDIVPFSKNTGLFNELSCQTAMTTFLLITADKLIQIGPSANQHPNAVLVERLSILRLWRTLRCMSGPCNVAAFNKHLESRSKDTLFNRRRIIDYGPCIIVVVFHVVTRHNREAVCHVQAITELAGLSIGAEWPNPYHSLEAWQAGKQAVHFGS